MFLKLYSYNLCMFIPQNLFLEMKHCSPVDPRQWMGAVRMRFQTADKNITIIHITPVHQIIYCEAKSCVFVRKTIIKTFLTSNVCYNMSHLCCVLHWKGHLVWIRREICTEQAKTALNKYVSGFWCERNKRWTFSLEDAFLWIMDSYLVRSEVKNVLMMSLL